MFRLAWNSDDFYGFADKMIHDDCASLETESAQCFSLVDSWNASVRKIEEAVAGALNASDVAKRKFTPPLRSKVVIDFEEIGARLMSNIDVAKTQDSFIRRS